MSLKASAQSIEQAEDSARSLGSIFADLFKARLTFLVILTSFVGFYLGSTGGLDWVLLAHTVLGTSLLASGASALNQYWERDLDGKMARTESRPIPSGELTASFVLRVGVISASLGMVYLAILVNPLTSVLGALTLVSYVFVYTPLKQITPLNTIIGAVPGALPPLMGWSAATNGVSLGGWSLFLILFFWQLPHFLAISWMYKDEYKSAGFKMLSTNDEEGRRTANHAISHTMGLLPVSISPFVCGVTNVVYVIGALCLGLVFLWFAIRFSQVRSRERARALFFWSIVYLPILLMLMVLDKAGS